MPRLLFEKTGNAVWISHLDLMRLFQRAFKRAGLPLTHTQGYNPRPSVSIALPLSVGIESNCELLDFDLYGEKTEHSIILDKLNVALVPGVKVLNVYEGERKIKHLVFLRCALTLEYDDPINEDVLERIRSLFTGNEVLVEKKSKNGISEQNIIPMIRQLQVMRCKDGVELEAVVCCQNPSLNPMQLSAAIERYLPDCKPDFVSCRRLEIYDSEMNVFR